MLFSKMQGCGNDFVVVEDKEVAEVKNLAGLAVKVCDRHFGIGADGLVIIGPAKEADIYMRVFNPDGSEAEMCGNAIRCVARYAYEKGLVKSKTVRVRTLAGIMCPEVRGEVDGQVLVRVDMGEPRLKPEDIPVKSSRRPVVGEVVEVEGREFVFTSVSMGNPHMVVFVGDLERIAVSHWGPLLENHPLFPRKTNVEFVKVLNSREMIMKVWERGAGETLACGTGACATLVAAVLNGLSEGQAVVHLPGGDLSIEWDKSTNHVFMTGPAEYVFTGTIAV